MMNVLILQISLNNYTVYVSHSETDHVNKSLGMSNNWFSKDDLLK